MPSQFWFPLPVNYLDRRKDGSNSDHFNLERAANLTRDSFVKKSTSKGEHPQHSGSAIPTVMLPTSSPGCISDLLDKYEIQRISRQLEQYIEISHAAYCNRGRKNSKPLPRRFWLWRRHAVVCGSRPTDVVETTASISRIHQ